MSAPKADAGLKKSTIHEAAKIAGVSIASVSRALNNKPGISEKTRKKILEICKELDYVPSTSARELTGSHKNTIAISLGPHEFYPSRYLGMLWPSLSASIRNSGRNLLPVSFGEVDLELVGGAILLGITHNDPRIDNCKKMGLPYVCIGMSEGSFWVAPDDFNGGREATQHLVDKGLTDICFVTPTTYGDGYQFRHQGYMSVMASNALPVRELRTGAEPLGEIAAYRYFINIDKKQLEGYQGFICECDETALGVIAALKDRGYTLPGDFSVVGYDGLPGISHELTTIEQDTDKIAARVASMLEQAMRREQPVGSVVPVSLKLGKTS
ncbi:LacI family DNA-binding transcriptional regulator [Vibrio paracholerae]|uniref:LacI family DNA-binding transcriptional regulator n=1 Tax=Vibrio paracholerae TaxID=650003 RepID=UPI001B36372B|nr:LacI family DNA-binding transcriptional regulator [Vibrio paracholerae]MBP8549251.1 substrate-binding domain-containing protein [Vibrio paracholerae]